MIIKTIQDIEKGFTHRNAKKIEALTKRKVSVGIHKKDNKIYENGETTAQVGYWQEYGTSKLPPRMWLRIITLLNEEKKLNLEAFKMAFNGTDDVDRILNYLGEHQKDRVRGRILRNGVVPHSQNKTGITLVDTGQLVEAIDYEVQ